MTAPRPAGTQLRAGGRRKTSPHWSKRRDFSHKQRSGGKRKSFFFFKAGEGADGREGAFPPAFIRVFIRDGARCALSYPSVWTPEYTSMGYWALVERHTPQRTCFHLEFQLFHPSYTPYRTQIVVNSTALVDESFLTGLSMTLFHHIYYIHWTPLG